jgi:hypothetical protein
MLKLVFGYGIYDGKTSFLVMVYYSGSQEGTTVLRHGTDADDLMIGMCLMANMTLVYSILVYV